MLSRVDLRGVPADRSAGWGDALVPLDTTIELDVAAQVGEIIADVRSRGDIALRELTARFDGCDIDELRVPAADLDAALDAVDSRFRDALGVAADQVTAYHETQRVPAERVHERRGIRVRDRVIPVDRAGLYVPGGRAAYPSTVLMTAIPARLAGVGEVALCTPPDRSGRVPVPTLAAAAMVGVDEVYRVGGVQAIAALAYGTDTIAPAAVVVGPGNAYVAAAKRAVAGVVGIESAAGPSDLVVVCDETVPPEWLAADLAAQAEHGPGGHLVLVTWRPEVAVAVDAALDDAVQHAARREEIQATLASGGRAVLVDDADAAMAVANELAPEHLELMTADPDALVPLVRNAGAVFCGAYAPTAVGDYVAGVNHVLPTGRGARFASALRVGDFQKHVHVVDVDAHALADIAPVVEALATLEGLDQHCRSVTVRRDSTPVQQ